MNQRLWQRTNILLLHQISLLLLTQCNLSCPSEPSTSPGHLTEGGKWMLVSFASGNFFDFAEKMRKIFRANIEIGRVEPIRIREVDQDIKLPMRQYLVKGGDQ